MKRLFLLLTVLIAAVTILGADVDLYGKINMGMWYQKNERFYKDTTIDVNNQDTSVGGDTMPIVVANWLPYGTFGVKYKGDKFGGCIEMGTRYTVFDSKFYGSATNGRIQRKVSDYITMEKWNAEWYINDVVSFLFGKEYSPTNFFPSNQMFYGGQYRFNNAGCLSTGASPMIQLKIKSPNDIFEGKIAVIKPDTTVIHIRADISTVNPQCSAKLPKFEAGFKYFIEKGIFSTYGNFAGGFQTYDVVRFEGEAILPKDSLYLKIPSFVVGTDLGVKVGAFSLSADVFYGQNIGTYGAFIGDKYNWWRIPYNDPLTGEEKFINKYMADFYPMHDSVWLDQTGEKLEWKLFNSTALGFAGILKIKPWNFLGFEGGFGMVIVDHEDNKMKRGLDYNRRSWYFQTELTAFNILKITPEVGQTDNGPLTGYGRYFYWGLNTGIEF